MSIKREKDFLEEWPELFDGAFHSCNFSLPIGWGELVWSLCVEIDKILNATKNVGNLQVVQVKSKFGGLRFYVDSKGIQQAPVRGDISQLIAEAEGLSRYICKRCAYTNKYKTAYAPDLRVGACVKGVSCMEVKIKTL